MTDIRLHGPDRIMHRSRSCTAGKRTTAKAPPGQRERKRDKLKKVVKSGGQKVAKFAKSDNDLAAIPAARFPLRNSIILVKSVTRESKAFSL